LDEHAAAIAPIRAKRSDAPSLGRVAMRPAYRLLTGAAIAAATRPAVAVNHRPGRPARGR
jgi:hypothetical protein